jgi:hypothetical protein
MRSRVHQLTWLALLGLTATAYSGDGPITPAPATTTPGVVLRFHNGSVIQPAVLLEPLEMETKLGKISIPFNELQKIDFGFRLTDEDSRKLEQALRDLSSSKFQAREAAVKTLIAMGRLAYPAVLEIRKGADLETTKRVEVVLSAIRSRVSAERLMTRKTDVVRTSDSVVAGRLTATTIRVKSDLFGEVKVPVSQLRELRTLGAVNDMTVAVDSSKYGNRNSWMMTEFEVSLGTKVDITATGEINLDPLMRLGGNAFTRGVRADGTPRLTSGEDYLPGKLVAKIGNNGPPFQVGSRYSFTPDREGKLYLRIATIEHANNIKADGSYQVRINAEPN